VRYWLQKKGDYNMEAEVTKIRALDMQVCVPKGWSDNQVIEFAEKENPCGTRNGWFIRKQESERLAGSDERVQCEKNKNNCHIILEA